MNHVHIYIYKIPYLLKFKTLWQWFASISSSEHSRTSGIQITERGDDRRCMRQNILSAISQLFLMWIEIPVGTGLPLNQFPTFLWIGFTSPVGLMISTVSSPWQHHTYQLKEGSHHSHIIDTTSGCAFWFLPAVQKQGWIIVEWEGVEKEKEVFNKQQEGQFKTHFS